ncbi:type IV pilus secretin PilQ [Marinospirillum sp.]|uniref:type IV pilus secretin PilQ n=1 Tax=Marinospirillum sp. TaxID=2183934 RepID=UPI0028708FF5|nr:type IV pilus secretin PilQ [Marinospirillum sp.]MDR9468842.1 type IV pilus secretin PilQ [Marinospirillum sp.]
MTLFSNSLHQISKKIIVGSLLCFGLSTALAAETTLQDLDFQRSPQGHALLLLEFSQPPVLPKAQEVAGSLELTFSNTRIQEELRNLYSTHDFATLVSSLSLDQEDDQALISLGIDKPYSYTLHQQATQLQIEIAEKPGQAKTETRNSGQRFQYSGEPMSLSYQDIPIRELLQELASFLDLNLVAGDSVQGNITLQLKEVPSDQALDLILTTQNLASRQVGNVLLVAPAEELVALEQQQFAARQSAQATQPLVDEFIRINFAKAEDLRNFIMGESETPSSNSSPTSPASLAAGLFNQGEQQESTTSGSNSRFLSDRGHLRFDNRTNQLYVRDTPEYVERVRTIVKTLDIPVDQIMIEARIVVARTGVSDELGVTWGASRTSNPSTSSFISERGRVGPGERTEFESTGSGQRGISLDFNPQAGIGFGFVNGNFLLDLELAALETENRSEIISQPKVITSDRNKAVIRSGEEIPYTSIDEDGVRTTNFRQAELRLEVTPQVVGDNQIFLTLQVNNDSMGEETLNAGPTINTNAVETQVLANNGETIVIGGIFTSQTLEAEAKTPLLGDIPLLGWLFRRSFQSQEKVELLIFITPRMLNNSLSQPLQSASD